MRLICWVLGHHWVSYKVTMTGWITNGDPMADLCLRCGRYQANALARLLARLASSFNA